MRKIFMTTILAFSLMFIVGVGRAEAKDVFVGNLNPTKEIYLITESLSGNKTNFKCAVHVVDRVSTLIWHYEFYAVGSEHRYTLIMNTGYRHHGAVFDGQNHSRPALNIWRYVQSNY